MGRYRALWRDAVGTVRSRTGPLPMPLVATLYLGMILAVFGLLTWWTSTPSVPSREEAATQAVARATRLGHPNGHAVCDEPRNDQWSCRIRDGEGRFGVALGSVRREASSVDPEMREDVTTWYVDFPLDATGGYTKDLTTTWDRAQAAVTSESWTALEAVGLDRSQTFACPKWGVTNPGSYSQQYVAQAGPPVGQGLTCTGTGPIASARIDHTASDTYRLSFTVPVPPEAR